MKISSFNIQHQPSLAEPAQLASHAELDIVCLPELKADRSGLSGRQKRLADLFSPAEAIRQGRLLRRVAQRDALERLGNPRAMATCHDSTGLQHDAHDGQCHYLEAAVNGPLVASIYAPNGNP